MGNTKNIEKGKKGISVLQLVGKTRSLGGATVRVYQEDQAGLITLASGTAAHTTQDGLAVYAKGAIYIKTDAATGVKSSYENIGTSSASVFALVGGEEVEDRTATAAGLTTGTISERTTHVTVTSDDVNKIIILPSPKVGKKLTLHNGATGYELRSSDPATIAINGGSGAAAESAIPANSTCFLTCVTATAWKGFFMDADGDLAKIEAAA